MEKQVKIQSFLSLMLTLCMLLTVHQVCGTKAGLAMSADNRVLQQSKPMIIDYIQETFKELDFDGFTVPIPGLKFTIKDVKFQYIQIEDEQLDVYIEGDRIKVRLRDVGGSLTGIATNKKALSRYRKGSDQHMTRFDFHCDQGGFKNIDIDLQISKHFVDGRTLPIAKVKWANFEFDRQKMRVDVDSDDNRIKAGAFVVSKFKNAFLIAFKPVLNTGFAVTANKALKMIQNRHRGNVKGGVIQAVTDMLPKNDIEIPHGIVINYEEEDADRARISNGRMIGYFKGEILNLPEDQVITEEKYLQVGDLHLTSKEPFEYQISTKVINNIFEVILGKNQVEQDVPYRYFAKVDFPMDWDSTAMDNIIPQFAYYVGYDRKLSAKFKNIGAPRFIFNQEEMNIKYSQEVELWDEDFKEYFLTIKFYDLQIDFDMWLEEMEILFEWNHIQMDRVEVTSDVVKNLERSNANKRATDAFKNAFKFIVPWVNTRRPWGVSRLPIPDTMDDLMTIRDLKMAVRDNYFSFTMDPQFIMKSSEEESSDLADDDLGEGANATQANKTAQHPKVKSSKSQTTCKGHDLFWEYVYDVFWGLVLPDE